MSNYGNIFKDIYWGSHEYVPSNQDIVKRRDQLVETHKITKFYELPYNESEDLPHLDHIEIYRTESGKVIFLYSVYDTCEYILDFNKKHKFEKADVLYSHGASSFMHIFDNLKELRAWARSFKQETKLYHFD